MDDLKIAYFAGFFDGEGSVSIRAQRKGDRIRPQYHLRVSIAQNRRAVLDEIKGYFGGSVCVCKMAPNSRLVRPICNWSCGSGLAAKFLTAVRPYLRVKGPAADLGLLFYKTFPFDPTRREETFAERDRLMQEMRAYNNGEREHWYLYPISGGVISDTYQYSGGSYEPQIQRKRRRAAGDSTP